MNKSILAPLFLLALLSSLASPARLLAEDSSPLPPILSASEYSYPPFAIVTKAGKAGGFSVDLLRAALKTMQREVSFQVGPWSEVKQALATGKIQVLPLVGRTPEREKVYDFTFSYLTMHGTIIVRQDRSDINTIADLHNKEVIVMKGDNAHEYVVREEVSSKIILTASYEEAMHLLSQGKHDAIIVQKLVGLQLIHSLEIENLKTVGNPIKGLKQNFCFAVKEGDKEMLSLLNEGLSIVTTDGTIDQLQQKWLGPLQEKTSESLHALQALLVVLVTLFFAGGVAYSWQYSLRRKVENKTLELRQTHDALKESEKRFKDLSDASDEAILFTKKNKIIDVNNTAMRMFGYDQYNDITGKRIIDFLNIDHSPNNLEILEGNHCSNQILKGKKTDDTEFDIEIKTKDFNYQGEVVRVTNIKDITVLRQLEEKLRQSQKMEAIGTLAGGIAHDFNNLLTPILGYSQLLKLSLDVDSNLQTYLVSIEKSANRAKDLVQKILIISRSSLASTTLVQLTKLLEEVLTVISSSIPKNIEIRQEIDFDLPLISADASQIYQVILNLCTNAIQAMAAGGTLLVKLNRLQINKAQALPDKEETTLICLTVQDNGQGMDSSTLDRIYEPFFTTKKKGAQRGTGLGLSIVASVVKQHGGDLEVESDPGIGTIFRLYLPAVLAEEAPCTEKAEPQVEQGNEHILLVDDETVLCEMATTILKNLGYRVTTFIDSRAALAAFKTNHQDFQLVMTDYSMPHLTGPELIEQMKAICPEIPMLLVTGYSNLATPENLKQWHCDGVIAKPYDINKFGQVVRQTLATHTTQPSSKH